MRRTLYIRIYLLLHIWCSFESILKIYMQYKIHKLSCILLSLLIHDVLERNVSNYKIWVWLFSFYQCFCLENDKETRIFLLHYMTPEPITRNIPEKMCCVDYILKTFICNKKILMTITTFLCVSQDGQMSCFPCVFHLIGYFSVHWPVGGLNNVFIKRASK